jgi:D-lactate dehydrogenase (cytochrome)
LRPGSRGISTDSCVPISRLAECITESKKALADSALITGIVGHVGDGNFHVLFLVDPENPAEISEAKRLNKTLVGLALAMGGTCTGEHGIGHGKMAYLSEELGDTALDVMRAMKRALDPHNLLNPGKIVSL